MTTNLFDTMGRVWKTTLPDNTSVTNEFFATGLLKKSSGSRTYPVEYTYDFAGRMKTMKTWQGFAANSGAAVTTWNYNQYRGWLDNKRYDDNTGPNYTYTAAGRLATRTWARTVSGSPLVTTYSYNNAGDMSGVDYSDTTADVTYGYDRRGRQTSVAQSGGTTTALKYDDLGSLLSETYSGGPLNGLIVSNRFDTLARRTNVAILSSSSTILASTTYGYDDASRLKTVADGVNTVAYSYLANSPLVTNIWFTNNTTLRMTTTKNYDLLNRLTGTTSAAGGSNVAVFNYAYNSANQRTTITNVDNSRWVYQYDSLGQVISGKKYWSDGTPVAGQQFEYGFDDIGNRKTTGAGGDAVGASLRLASYTNNAINQITGRSVPGFVNVLGTAKTNATVSIWGDNGGFSATSRKGEYFRGEIPFNNTTGAMWLTITNVAAISNYNTPDIVTNTVGKTLLAKNPETFTYDVDGNQTSNSLWTNMWNGENRRVTIESRSTLPAGAKVKEVWTHLADGRWIERLVSTNNGTAYFASLTNRYVWDNQVLLAVLDHTNGVVVSFMRGLDLSGSIQGAGGVGGVLAIKVETAVPSSPLANTTHFTCYDGNGNVTALVNAATGAESARYEYGAFAERLRETGPMAKLNPIRFSTQYTDDVISDVKYLFRDYTADTGRWLSRDPIEEKGGINVYCFIRNMPIQNIDILGLQGKIPGGPYPFPWPIPTHPPYEPPVPKPNPATDSWRICCQPVKGNSLVTHCDLRWYPCDTESSVEYPVTRDPKCCKKTIKSDFDMKKCFSKQGQGGGYLPWSNCQVDAWEALKACCGKTKWTPSWYIMTGDSCPPEYYLLP